MTATIDLKLDYVILLNYIISEDSISTHDASTFDYVSRAHCQQLALTASLVEESCTASLVES